MANQNVFTVTDQDFKTSVLDSKEPVLVDFWAEWCGPCRALAPTIDELATDFVGKAKIVKLDVDKNPNIAAQYEIRGIPAVYIFKDGQVIVKIIGRRGKEQYAEALTKAISTPS
jgi:thioredoxin 1